jgi:hypothetical protein
MRRLFWSSGSNYEIVSGIRTDFSESLSEALLHQTGEVPYGPFVYCAFAMIGESPVTSPLTQRTGDVVA